MILKLFYQLHQLYLLIKFKREWRKSNAHNFTTVKNVFPKSVVTVGQMTYGVLEVNHFFNPDEKLRIGNYVSIANNVQFILGGNHHFSGLTNYPIYSKFLKNNPKYDAKTKGEIIVEDEVWIGTNVIILSGVRIGKGAIIASGSVITKDIPPYAIAGGNPARILKYRFEDHIIKEIKDIYLDDIPHQFIKDHVEDFYKVPDTNSAFIKGLKKR